LDRACDISCVVLFCILAIIRLKRNLGAFYATDIRRLSPLNIRICTKERFKVDCFVQTRNSSEGNRVCRIVVASWFLLRQLKYESLCLTYLKVEVRLFYVEIISAPDETRQDFYPN